MEYPETLSPEPLGTKIQIEVGSFEIEILTIDQDELGSEKLFSTEKRGYDRFNKERGDNIESELNIGGVVLMTTEEDGTHRIIMIINDDSLTPETINKENYDKDGLLIPLELAVKDRVAQRLEDQTGVAPDQIQISITTVTSEKDSELPHKIGAIAVTDLSYEQLCKANRLRGKEPNARLIGLPAKKEIIEILVSKLKYPLPPSLMGVYLSIGYKEVMAKDGEEEAKKWLKGLEEKVESNISATNEKGGKRELINELWNLRLLNSINSNEEIATSPEVLQPSELCITGSIHFPKYPTDESDKTRGTLALEAIRNTLKDGYSMVVVISRKTSEEYKAELEKLAVGNLKGKLRLVVEDEKSSYSGARRQAVNEALKFDPQPRYVATCEIEKKALEEYFQDFLQVYNDKGELVGILLLDRGIAERNPNLPLAQDSGELHQNIAIMRHLIDAGFFPPGTKILDLLNGTRVFINALIDTKFGIKINPIDLLNLTYEYEQGDVDPGVAMKEKFNISYTVDHYSAAVYHLVTMAIALGIGVEQVKVRYKHDEQQRALEEGEQRKSFENKREAQARAIIDQNFDLVANICKWKEDGLWPGVVIDAINNKTPIKLHHYSSLEYSIKDGKLLRKPY